jgi:hypothetical protein
MTIVVAFLLGALVVLVLLPVLLLSEWRLWRRTREPYRREIPITRTERRAVDLTGVKPKGRA